MDSKFNGEIILNEIISKLDNLTKVKNMSMSDELVVDKCTVILLDYLSETTTAEEANVILDVARDLFIKEIIKGSTYPHKLLLTFFSLTSHTKWRSYFPSIKYIFSQDYPNIRIKLANQIATSLFNLLESKIHYCQDPSIVQELNVLEFEIMGMAHESMANRRNDVYKPKLDILDISLDSKDEDKDLSSTGMEEDNVGSDDGEIIEEDTIFTELDIVLRNPKSYRRYLEESYTILMKYLNDPYKIVTKGNVISYCIAGKAFLKKLDAIKCEPTNGEAITVERVYENFKTLFAGVDRKFKKFANSTFRLKFLLQLKIVNHYIGNGDYSCTDYKLKDVDREEFNKFEDVLEQFIKKTLYNMRDVPVEATYVKIVERISSEKLFFSIKNRKRQNAETSKVPSDIPWPKLNKCFDICDEFNDNDVS
uniref:Telomere length regulation protein TEL2 homolog n=1 Tax=Parastrongyloides trichosuri TaxID=131310 RepID=A0A0N4ZJA5_PARTI